MQVIAQVGACCKTVTMTVLIVEDDRVYQYALSRALEAAGRKPVICDDWHDYLDRVERDPDVRSVVLDVKLPEGTPNGISLARMTFMKRPDLKLVVVSNDPALLYDLPPSAKAYPKSASLKEIAAAAND